MNKLCQTAVTVLMSFFILNAATIFETTVSKMTARSFRPLSTQGLSGEMTHTGAVSDIVFAFSDNATWDPVSHQLMFLGCPHYSPWRFLVYKDSTNMWRSESLPNPSMNLGGSAYIGHAYDNNTVDTKRGHFYTFTGQGDLYRFKTETNRWETLEQKGSKPTTTWGMALDYFPDIDKIVHVVGGKVSLLDISTLTWSALKSGLEMGSYHNMMEYDPVHHIMIFGGGTESSTLHKMDTLLRTIKLAPPPVTISIPSTIMTADPVTGKLLIMSQNKFYAFDADADSWELLSSDISTIAGLKTFSISGTVAAPISTYGVNAFISTYSFPVLLYRYAPINETETPIHKATDNISISLSPHPFTSQSIVHYEVPGAKRVNLYVHDVNGKLLTSTIISGEKGAWKIDNDKVSTGLSIIRAKGDNGKTISIKAIRK